MSLICFVPNLFDLSHCRNAPQRPMTRINGHLYDLEPVRYLYIDDDSESIRNIFH